MAKFLSIFVIAILGSGCCHAVDVPIGLPARPVLIDLDQQTWERLPPEAQDAWDHNDLALKEYASRLEARILLHDGRLDP